MTRADGAAQVAQRSLVATLEITAAASAAHVLAGGRLPSVGYLVAFGLVVLACCLATIGRFLRVAAVVPVVLAAQVGLHAALHASPAAHHSMSGMDAGATGPFGLTTQMFWAHLVTAVVTAIVLLLQERVLAAVVGWLRPVDAPVAGPVRRVGPTSRYAARTASRQLLLRVSPRRGPPLLAAMP